MEIPTALRLLVAATGRAKGLTPCRIAALRPAVSLPTVTPRAHVDRTTTTVAHVTAAIRTTFQDPDLDKRSGLRHPAGAILDLWGVPTQTSPAVGIPAWTRRRRLFILPLNETTNAR